MSPADWADGSALAVALYLDGSDAPDRAADGAPLLDDDFLVLVNAWWEPLDFVLPHTRAGAGWHVEVDTFGRRSPARARWPAPPWPAGPGTSWRGRGRVVVLRSPRPQACQRGDLDGDLAAQPGPALQLQVVTAPEPAGVVPLRLVPSGQQAHGLVGGRHDLRAVRALQGAVRPLGVPGRAAPGWRAAGAPAPGRAPGAAGETAEQPPAGEARGAGERGTVQPGDGAQQRILHSGQRRVLQLAQPRVLAVPGRPDPLTAARRSCSWTPRCRDPDQMSSSERPSSACHISGGRSSITTDMPTWFTGLFVPTRIARSASVWPRNSQMSPVRVCSRASFSVMRADGRHGRSLGRCAGGK